MGDDHECESPIGDIITPQATFEKSLANLFTWFMEEFIWKPYYFCDYLLNSIKLMTINK